MNYLLLFVLMLGAQAAIGQDQAADMPKLTRLEKALGFALIFDGKTLNGWTGYRMDHPPKNWTAKDGVLTCRPGSEGGDLRTADMYGDFELVLEYRMSPGGNSGIMYRSTEDREASWQTGPEFQLLDDKAHNMPADGVTSSGAVYDFYGPKGKVLKPAGEWNEVRIVACGNHIEHWMNGVKVVEYEIGSPEWTSIYQKTKFAEFPDFGRHPRGYIVLQDHGHEVSFRNIRVRKL